LIPRQHQIEEALWALTTIRKSGLAYLTWQERTGKTLTALLTVEQSKAKTCLIVTKKKAIDGWVETLEQWQHKTKFAVTNYERLHKVTAKFEFIILDESHHAISSTGRPSATWKKLYPIVHGKPILYLSATPYAEHLGLIYHQLKLSYWSPFKVHKNFYDWFRKYGVPNLTRTPYGLVETYTKYKDDEILEKIEHLFDFKTRTQVGIKQEPSVNVIEIEMGELNKDLINQLKNHSVIELPTGDIVCDSPMKERMVHYQIEGGTIKTEDGFVKCGMEKINYIKDNYAQKEIAIMAHFIAERKILRAEFPKALILSSDGDAEGVDLSRIEKLLIYSMSFKTSKYAQRIARQANHSRETPIVVDVLVGSKPAIGMEVYKAVAIKKENFDKNSYERAL